MQLSYPITLYKGFWDNEHSPKPLELASKGVCLHFTPYLAIAEFYAQNGFLATYLCNFHTIAQPHPDNSSPPLDFIVQDYEILLKPSHILLLEFISTTPGRLLPGSTIIGPKGEILFKDTLLPKKYPQPLPYHTSHFT